MIFIWRGWGILVVVYAFVAFVIGTIIGNSVGGGLHAGASVGVCEVIAGVAVWFTGNRLNRNGDRMLMDPKTGAEVRVRRRHTLFWIPMQYWAPVLAIAGIIVLIAALAR
jgi:ABC-type antimicrobial peptide transport system permease subunit